MTPEEERLARNEAMFREANERVELAALSLEADRLVPFICECGRRECTTIVQVTLADYERIRTVPTHFLYAPGHDRGMSQSTVVETLAGAAIVQKHNGPGRIAAETDPRSGTLGST